MYLTNPRATEHTLILHLGREPAGYMYQDEIANNQTLKNYFEQQPAWKLLLNMGVC